MRGRPAVPLLRKKRDKRRGARFFSQLKINLDKFFLFHILYSLYRLLEVLLNAHSMLNKKTKYGLHALIHLAREYSQGSVLITDLAEEEGLPKKFLEAILLDLKKQGLLLSKKGKGGGYALAKPPDQIRLGQVIRVLEGPLAPVSCVSQTMYRRCEECRDERLCPIRMVMKDVRDATANILDQTSLNDVLEKVRTVQDKNVFDYMI